MLILCFHTDVVAVLEIFFYKNNVSRETDVPEVFIATMMSFQWVMILSKLSVINTVFLVKY